MLYKDKNLCSVRTITTFVTFSKDKSKWKALIERAARFCTQLSEKFQQQGYKVQSIRIVTNPFGEYLSIDSSGSAKSDLQYINDIIERVNQSGIRIRFAIGEAKTNKELRLLPELIKHYGDLCNACVNIKSNDLGLLDETLLVDAVDVVSILASTTPRGEGNFNFTVNFNCDPLIPYFPASYHDSSLDDSFVIGLETPNLLVSALEYVNKNKKNNLSRYQLMQEYYRSLQEALQFHIDNIVNIANVFDGKKSGFVFSGIDTSAAPSKTCASMTQLYELMGVEYFGAAGTVEISALLTRVFKSVTGVEQVGFSGLMLALTEDTGLAKGAEQGHFDIRTLLTNSAVCGIGLDTVPIPGDTPREKILGLMRDTGTMAYRLNKPLTVRLFPVPGLKAGDMTHFESDDLCNSAVLSAC
ncbi:MAG: DUF711 family protein [Cellvibrionaceae bacterium]